MDGGGGRRNDIHFADGEKKMTWLNCGTSYATRRGVVAFGSRNVSSYPRSVNFVGQYSNAGNNAIPKRTLETATERGEGLLLEFFVEYDEDAVPRARLGINKASEGEDGRGESA